MAKKVIEGTFDNASDLVAALEKSGVKTLTSEDMKSVIEDVYREESQSERETRKQMADKAENIAKLLSKIDTAYGTNFDVTWTMRKEGEVTKITFHADPKEHAKHRAEKIELDFDLSSSTNVLRHGMPAIQIRRPRLKEYGKAVYTSVEQEALSTLLKYGEQRNNDQYKYTQAGLERAINAVRASEITTNEAVLVDRAKYKAEMNGAANSLARDWMLQASEQQQAIIADVIDLAQEKFKKSIKVSRKFGDVDYEATATDDVLGRHLTTFLGIAKGRGFGTNSADRLKLAKAFLKNRGYSDEVIEYMSGAFGDYLKVGQKTHLSSDKMYSTGVVSTTGIKGYLMGGKGNAGRAGQFTNSMKKFRPKYSAESGFFMPDLVDKSIDMTTLNEEQQAEFARVATSRVDQKMLKEAYDEARKEAEAETRALLAGKYEGDELETRVLTRLKALGFGSSANEFSPSLWDNMSIVRESTMEAVKGYRDRSKTLTNTHYDSMTKEIREKIKKMVADAERRDKDDPNKKTLTYGDKKYENTKEGRSQLFKDIMASKVLNIPIKDLQDVEISKEDDQVKISAIQTRGERQMVKGLTNLNERTYLLTLQDEAYNVVLKKLREKVEKETGIKLGDIQRLYGARSAKAADIFPLIMERIQYLYHTADEEGRKNIMKVLKGANSPLQKFFEGDDLKYTTSDEATRFFDENGGIEGLVDLAVGQKWITRRQLAGLDPVEYTSTLGLGDIFDWTRRISITNKERAGQRHIGKMSGSSEEYLKEMEERYRGEKGAGANRVKKAKHDINQINKALRKTAESGKWTDEQKKAELAKAYSETNKSGTLITIGKGDGYTINTDQFKDVKAEYEEGHLSEEEYKKLWEGRVLKARQDIIDQQGPGFNPDDIEVAVDTGSVFGFTDPYGKQVSGKLLYVGGMAPNTSKADDGTVVYDRFAHGGAVGDVIDAINEDRSASYKSRTATHAIMTMIGATREEHGSLKEAAEKISLGHSYNLKPMSISPLDVQKYEQQLEEMKKNGAGKADISAMGEKIKNLKVSGFVSEDRMRQLLSDEYDYEQDEEGNLTEAGMQDYFDRLYAAYVDSAGGDNEELKKMTQGITSDNYSQRKSKLIDALLKVARVKGLKGIFGRFPDLETQFGHNSRLFIDEDIKDDDIIRLGEGLAQALKADYDGDIIQVALKMLRNYKGDETLTYDQNVLLKVYDKTVKQKQKKESGMSKEEKEEKELAKLQEETEKANNPFMQELAGLAAKEHFQYVGVFSNWNTRLRHFLSTKGAYFDEDSLKGDKATTGQLEDVFEGLLAKATLQTVEQEAISSKKILDRIFEKYKEATKDGQELTEEKKEQIITEVLGEFEDLQTRLNAKAMESDNAFIDELGRMGLSKDGKFDSLAFQKAVSQMEAKLEQMGKSEEEIDTFFKKFFGDDFKEILKTGEVSVERVKSAYAKISKTLRGMPGGLREGQGLLHAMGEFGAPVISSRGQGVYTNDAYGATSEVFDGLTESVKEANKVFDEHGNIIKDLADIKNKENQLEILKAGIATREAGSIDEASEAWGKYFDHIQETYNLLQEFNALQLDAKNPNSKENPNFYIEGKGQLAEMGLEKTSPSRLKKDLFPDSYTKNYVGAVKKEDIEKHTYKWLSDEEHYGQEELDKYYKSEISRLGGIYAGLVGQITVATKAGLSDSIIKGLKEQLEKTKAEMRTVSRKTGHGKNLKDTFSVYGKAGENFAEYVTDVGEAIGVEAPISGMLGNSTLMSGYMDVIARETDKSSGKNIFHIFENKAHYNGQYEYGDVVQIALYREFLEQQQKTLRKKFGRKNKTTGKFELTNGEEALRAFKAALAKSSPIMDNEKINTLLNTYTEDDLLALIQRDTEIAAHLLVGDVGKGGGKVTKYDVKSMPSELLRKIKNKEVLSDKETKGWIAGSITATEEKSGLDTRAALEERYRKIKEEEKDLLLQKHKNEISLRKTSISDEEKVQIEEANRKIEEQLTLLKERAKSAREFHSDLSDKWGFGDEDYDLIDKEFKTSLGAEKNKASLEEQIRLLGELHKAYSELDKEKKRQEKAISEGLDTETLDKSNDLVTKAQAEVDRLKAVATSAGLNTEVTALQNISDVEEEIKKKKAERAKQDEDEKQRVKDLEDYKKAAIELNKVIEKRIELERQLKNQGLSDVEKTNKEALLEMVRAEETELKTKQSGIAKQYEDDTGFTKEIKDFDTNKKVEDLTVAEEQYEKALQNRYSLELKVKQFEQEWAGKLEEDGSQKILYKHLLSLWSQAKEIENSIGTRYEELGGSNKNDLSSYYKAQFDLESQKYRGGNAPRQQGFLEQLGYSGNGLTRMITQYFSLYRIIGKLRQEISKVIQITKQLDQAATNIRIVTGMNREEVDNAILAYGRLAAQLGTTTTALAQSANEWLRQGYSISDSMKLIEETTKLSKLGMLDMSSATKVLTSTLKGFKMEASEAGKIVDKLTALDMNYAASAGEIGEALSRTAAIAQQMGISLDETSAMVTTIMDVTQQSAEMAGTAVRSILSRYGNVKSGSFMSMMTDGEDLEKINDIEKVLNVLGIQVRSAKMEMRDMGDVLDELADKWATLSSVEQNAVATAFAGKMCA